MSPAMSTFTPLRAATAPWAASALSAWASSHLLQAQSSLSSSLMGFIYGLGPLVPRGRATSTRKPCPFSAEQGA